MSGLAFRRGASEPGYGAVEHAGGDLSLAVNRVAIERTPGHINVCVLRPQIPPGEAVPGTNGNGAGCNSEVNMHIRSR